MILNISNRNTLSTESLPASLLKTRSDSRPLPVLSGGAIAAAANLWSAQKLHAHLFVLTLGYSQRLFARPCRVSGRPR